MVYRLYVEKKPGYDHEARALAAELRDFLGSFNFRGDMATSPIEPFSGGEKARLALALIVWQRPNLLLLDEPTNHLDLTTREALSMALNSFEGTLMLVSHDRALLREVCDEFWLVTKGGVSEFDGDLDDYQKWLLEQSRLQAAELKAASKQALKTPAAPVAAPVAAPIAPPPASNSNRKEERKAQAEAAQKLSAQAKPLKAELAKVEARMAAIGTEQDQLNALLADPAATAASRVEQGRKLKQLGEENDALEAKWLNLSESLQLLQQG